MKRLHKIYHHFVIIFIGIVSLTVDFSPEIGNNHKQVVARSMLGALEWMDECKQDQAIIDWRRCITEFECLMLWTNRQKNQTKKKWYADHCYILQADLLDWMAGTRTKRQQEPNPRFPSAPVDSSPPYQNLMSLRSRIGSTTIGKQLEHYPGLPFIRQLLGRCLSHLLTL